MISERLSTLGTMKASGLRSALTAEFSENEIMKCCALLENEQINSTGIHNCPRVQRALIGIPEFPALYASLLRLGVTDWQIECWLETEQKTGCKLMNYTAEEIVEGYNLTLPSLTAQQEYMLFYHPMQAGSDEQTILLKNIALFYKQKKITLSDLDATQRDILRRRFFDGLLDVEHAASILPVLAQHPVLVALLSDLKAADVEYPFRYQELNLLTGMDDLMREKLRRIHSILGSSPDRMHGFLAVWLDNGAPAGDLDLMLRKAASLPPNQQDELLSTKLFYINALYNGALDDIPFRSVPGHMLPLLVYAIDKKQNAFLRLATQSFDLLCGLGEDSMLFSAHFYSRIRLNSLTIANLKDCRANPGKTLNLHKLEQRTYTFEELKVLRFAPIACLRLYDALSLPRVDDRLIVIRQLLKRNLLTENISDAALTRLASLLSQKPLVRWMEQDLAHIAGMSPEGCLSLLQSYDRVARFLPEILSADEAAFAVRHIDKLAEYVSWADVRANVEQLDTAWHNLRSTLDLDDAFVKRNEPQILRFLSREGADIVQTYAECLADPEGFYRIVRAELMGQFEALKYYKDDLRRELDYPITSAQKHRWAEHLEIRRDHFTAVEYDDFFTTMHIGGVPHYTCLNYRTGAQRECLLSTFDSNKKILMAYRDGRAVARAIIRLTKGYSADNRKAKATALEFADLRSDKKGSISAKGRNEDLVLFLETSYTSGLNNQETQLVKRLFAELAKQKSEQLGARAVLSARYADAVPGMGFASMSYHVFISKSKAGSQYLDSLNGANTVSNEGSYRCNLFSVATE